MPRPKSTSESSFDKSEFGFGNQAQLVIQPGTHATYQDGDVLCAFNRRHIRCVHAEQICHVKHVAFNSDGLNPLRSLPEIFLREVYQYKFERISQTEVRRTTLATSDEVVIGSTPTLIDGRNQHIAVEEFLARRKSHPRHRIFGTEGNEVWYGGKTDPSWGKLDTIWEEIEAVTSHRETDADKRLWPATARELARFLIISVNDFDDDTAGDLVAPLTDPPTPTLENVTVVSKRKTWIPWRDLRDTVESDVLNYSLQVDIRGRKEVHQEIKNVRTV